MSMANALLAFAALLSGQGPYRDEVVQSLRGKPENAHEFKRTGPDAGQCVHFEPEGLRIQLPAGYPGERPSTGMLTRLDVRGDFEITVAYDILQAPDKGQAGKQTRFSLGILLDQARPRQEMATLSRMVSGTKGPMLVAWSSLWNQAAGKNVSRVREVTAGAPTGRLRLVRTGGLLAHYVAEGPGEDFKLLQEEPFPTDDLKDVRLVAATGSPEAALDVRLTDLRIRATAIANAEAVTKVTPPAAGEETPTILDYRQSLKGSRESLQGLELIRFEAGECVKYEPEGVRISLPTGHPRVRPGIGVATTFALKGDFEATVHYEIITEPEPQDAGTGSSLSLMVELGPPTNLDILSMSRSCHPEGKRSYRATQWKFENGKEKMTGRTFATQARSGYLRLARTGAILSYLVADEPGTDFTLLHEQTFTPEAVRRVRLSATTGGPDAALDVRFTDLYIRALAVPEAPAEASRKSRWKIELVLALAAALLAAVWLALRQARRTGGTGATTG
jgi:hypothetical protein